MNVRSLLFTLTFLMSSSALSAKVLIWDIGDVLFEKSTFGYMKSIGLSHLLEHILFDWKNPWKLETRFFEVVSQLECEPVPEGIHLRNARGVLLPPIMSHWQAGTLSSEEIINRAHTKIEVLAEQGTFFASHREKELIKKAVAAVFNPHTLAHNMRPIRAGIRLLEQCATEINPDGTPRNKLIALSNWDPFSFEILHELNRDVFGFFDDILISGRTGFIKPRKAAFQYLVDLHKLNPTECLFIDDREENLEAAEALGFNTFHLQRGNYRELRQVLLDFGALLGA